MTVIPALPPSPYPSQEWFWCCFQGTSACIEVRLRRAVNVQR